MLAHNTSDHADHYRLMGMLYLALSVIANAQKDKLEAPSGNAYVNHAISYIQNHYSMPMKVEELSDYVGINRSYFSDLFKQYTGMSPVKYLQNFRITKAQHMLTISELSIESIAFSCGYQSAEAFHKIFRKTTGMSPNAYRQEKRQRTLSSQETMNNNRPDYIDTDDDFKIISSGKGTRHYYKFLLSFPPNYHHNNRCTYAQSPYSKCPNSYFLPHLCIIQFYPRNYYANT